MASDATQMNNFLKFLQMLTSGDLASVMGTADPISVAQEQISSEPSAPLTEAYLSSDNEDIRRVFSGLVAGELDPITAKGELLTSFADQPELATSLGAAVDSVIKEQADFRKATKDANQSKGYLPKMTERYSDNPSIAPLLPKAQKAVSTIDKRLAMLDTLTPQLPMHPGKLVEQQKKVLSAISPELGNQVSSMDPESQARFYGQIKQMVASEKARRDKVVAQNVSTLEQAGRSPYQDALLKRALALAPFFQQ